MSSITPEIKPRDCGYQCGTRIYWSTADNAYFEVFTKQRHQCPNRSSNNRVTNNKISSHEIAKNDNFKYYSKKPWVQKTKMSNSLEVLSGPISEIQKKYETLSDIVIIEYLGKIHGSQQSRDPKTGLIDLLVYYEVPEGKKLISRVEKVNNKYFNN